jgi:hypothetical protein
VPESKGRKKEPFTPPPSKGERKVAKIGSPGWLAPAMVACFVIGLVYIVIFYIAGSEIPIMNSIGGQANGLVNVGIGFGFIIVGFMLVHEVEVGRRPAAQAPSRIGGFST